MLNDSMCAWCKTVIRLTGDEEATFWNGTQYTYHPECEIAAIQYAERFVGYDLLESQVLSGTAAGVRGQPELRYTRPPKPTYRRIKCSDK